MVISSLAVAVWHSLTIAVREALAIEALPPWIKAPTTTTGNL